MKIALAVLALVAALQPQQQTFYSAKAQPKPVPAHTAQAVDPGYLYYAANCNGGRHGKSRCAHGRPSPRPSHRPAPHHT